MDRSILGRGLSQQRDPTTLNRSKPRDTLAVAGVAIQRAKPPARAHSESCLTLGHEYKPKRAVHPVLKSGREKLRSYDKRISKPPVILSTQIVNLLIYQSQCSQASESPLSTSLRRLITRQRLHALPLGQDASANGSPYRSTLDEFLIAAIERVLGPTAPRRAGATPFMRRRSTPRRAAAKIR